MRGTIFWAAVLAGGATLAGATDLLAPGAMPRLVAISFRGGSPMIAARIDGRQGVVMFDTGAAYDLMLNRDALHLAPGDEVARGHAASGQAIVVMLHPAPEVAIAGQPFVPDGPALSGNFGFTRDGLGNDFLGFVGLPAVAGDVFALDYGRRLLALWPATGDRPDGPPAGDVLAAADVTLSADGLPGWAGQVGPVPVAIDIDTGDGGTLYLTEGSRARLLADGVLVPAAGAGAATGGGAAAADRAVLSGLRFAGADFAAVDVAVVAAGGPDDMRQGARGDLLRLGAGFLRLYPSFWDIPVGRIVFLRSGAVFPALP